MKTLRFRMIIFIIFCVFLALQFCCWAVSPAGKVSTNIVHHAMHNCIFKLKNCNVKLSLSDITPFKWNSLYIVPNESFEEGEIIQQINHEKVNIDITEFTQMVFLLDGKEVYRENLKWGGGVYHMLFEDDGNLFLGYQVEWVAPLNKSHHNNDHFYYYCNLTTKVNIQEISPKLIVKVKPEDCHTMLFEKIGSSTISFN